jgi:hypothetical protein
MFRKPNETVQASNVPSGRGGCIASPTMNSTFPDRPAAFRFASSIISVEKSSPTTRLAPALAIANARSPVPVAISSTTGWPSGTEAIASFATRFRQRSSMPPVMIRFIRS